MFKKNFLVLISLFFIFVIFSCKSKTEDSGIFINNGIEPKTMDPNLNNESQVSTYLFHTFEGLTRKDKDNKLASGTAEKWTVSDDGKVYTFYIRSNAMWSDGKPVTANDFLYSWKRTVDPVTAAPYAYMIEPVKNAKDITAGKKSLDTLGVKVIDNNTLEVTLENPTPYFLELIATTGCYLPVREDIVSVSPETWSEKPETYIGNGAYKMTERKIDESITFELNTNYWAKDEIIANKITFVLISDAAAKIAAIKNGTLHFGLTPASEVESLRKEGFIVDSQALGTYYIEINITNKALSNPKVRRALAISIDRDYIIKNIMRGTQLPAGAFVPYKINDYKGDFRENGGDFIDVNPTNYEKNIVEAKKLMAEAGYPDGKNFPVLSLIAVPGIPTLFCEAIQQMWKENLGIDIVLSSEEYAISLGRFRDKTFQMARSGWTGDYNDPMTMLDLFVSYSDMNFNGFNNKEYDDLIAFAKSTSDNAKRMEALHKAESILFDTMPIIPLYYRSDSYMVSPKLKGYILDPLARHKFHYSYLEK